MPLIRKKHSSNKDAANAGNVGAVKAKSGKPIRYEDPTTTLLLSVDELIEKKCFNEAREHLQRMPPSEDSQLALARVDLLQGDINKAMAVFESTLASASRMTERDKSMRITTQAYILRGLAYEKSRNFQKALESYEEGIQSAMRLHETGAMDRRTAIMAEDTLARSPALRVHLMNDVEIGLATYRINVVRASEITSRNCPKVLRGFARFLLFSCPPASYTPPQKPSTSKPVYCPSSRLEEASLVLMLLEPLELTPLPKNGAITPLVAPSTSRSRIGSDGASRSGSVDMGAGRISFALDPDLDEDHSSTLAVDLLAFALAPLRQYHLIVSGYERALSRNFDSKELQLRMVLALMAAGHAKRASIMLKKCIEQSPHDPNLHLLATKVCVNNLHQGAEAVKHAQEAVKLTKMSSPRAYHALGVACSTWSSQVQSFGEKKALQEQALEALLLAHSLDGDDINIAFHLALQYALIRDVSSALERVRDVLWVTKDHAPSWALLVLLLSANTQNTDALNACHLALTQFPLDPLLLLIKAALETLVEGPTVALNTYHFLLSALSNQPLPTQPISLEEIPKKRYALEYSQDAVVPGSKLEAHVWLSIAETYLLLSLPQDASYCIQQAQEFDPLSPDLYYLRGRVCEWSGRLEEAKAMYEAAIAINPRHSNASVHLGQCLQADSQHLLAEQLFTSALRIDSTDHVAWHQLGLSLEAQNRFDQASDAFEVALKLQDTAPILPFSKIPMTL